MEQPKPGLLPSLIVVALAAIAAFANSLNNELTYDAYYLVEQNDTLRRAARASSFGERTEVLSELFGEEFWDGVNRYRNDPAFQIEGQALYRPLMLLSLGVIYTSFGADPTAFNVYNLLLHVLTSVLVVRIAFQLSRDRRIAFFAGLLFAVHPIHSEAVANAAGIGETQAAFFGLLALDLYLRGTAYGMLRWGRIALAVLSFAAALFTKEGSVAILLLAILADVARGAAAPGFGKRAAVYLAFAAVLAANIAIRLEVCGRLVPNPDTITRLDNPLIKEAFASRLATGAMLFARALQLFVLPVGQASDYSFNQLAVAKSLAEPAALSAFVLCAVLTVLGLASLRARPAFGFGLLAFLLTFGPVSNIVAPIGTIFAERVLYLPSVGLSIAGGALIGGLLGVLERRRGETAGVLHRVARSLCVVLLLVLAVTVAFRNRAYASRDTLFEDMVRTAPESARGYYQRGELSRSNGLPQAAINDFRTAIRIMPDFLHARQQLGKTYAQTGEYKQAAETYAELLALLEDRGPGAGIRAQVSRELSGVYDLWGRGAKPGGGPSTSTQENLDEVIAFLEQQLREQPGNAAVIAALSAYYTEKGRTEDARVLVSQSLLADPDNVQLKLAMGAIEARSQNMTRLRELLDEIGEVQDPQLRQTALLYRGIVQYNEALTAFVVEGRDAGRAKGDVARKTLQEYLELDPTSWWGHMTMAQLQQDVYEDLEGALNSLQQVLSAIPNHSEALLRTHQIVALQGLSNEGIVKVSNQLAEVFPDNQGFWFDRARILAASGHPDDAVEAMKKAIGLGLDGVVSRSLLAQYLTQAGKPEEAISTVVEAQTYLAKNVGGREFPELAHAHAVALLELKDYPGAYAKFEEALGIAARSEDLAAQVPMRSFHRDKTLLRIPGREREGYERLQTLLADLEAAAQGSNGAGGGLSQPSMQQLRPFILRQLAWARLNVAELMEPSLAIDLLKQALDVGGKVSTSEADRADLWIDLGDAYEKSDRLDDAIAALQEAAKLRRSDAELRKRIEELQIKKKA
jgi:tetratricopeptide (TPR) repeat protein